jgi:MSHA pilin protein MshB
MKRQSGFTLVELIIVIVLIGVLAVIAVPRFLSFAEDAQRATFKGIAGAFRAGVDQVHLAWLVRINGRI